MTKDDLIKKFPKPQFGKFPDSKITELIDLCLDTAKSYHQINEIIISNIIFRAPTLKPSSKLGNARVAITYFV